MNCISLIMLLLYISLLFAKTFGTRVNVRHRSLVERKKPSQLKFRNVPAAAAPVPDEDNDEGVQDSSLIKCFLTINPIFVYR